jgi:molybdate transport system permease protein
VERSNRQLGRSNFLFVFSFSAITALYVFFIVLLIVANVAFIQSKGGIFTEILSILKLQEIQNSIILSLLTCSLSAFLATAVAIPIAYLLSRFKEKWVVFLDVLMDIPLVLPPLLIGLSLLILFHLPIFNSPLGEYLPFLGSDTNTTLKSLVVYQIPAIVLAQFTVATAFAVRTLKLSYEQIDKRPEQFAFTLGASRFQAFYHIVLPKVRPGILTAWTLAWARSLGEFGPILIFAGATRNKTEVLSTSVFLELSIGNIKGAVALSLIMISVSIFILISARLFGKSPLI